MKKDHDSFILIIVGIVAGTLLFVGLIKFIGNYLRKANEPQSIKNIDLEEQQRRKIEELKKKEKRLREEQKQRLLDHQRRN